MVKFHFFFKKLLFVLAKGKVLSACLVYLVVPPLNDLIVLIILFVYAGNFKPGLLDQCMPDFVWEALVCMCVCVHVCVCVCVLAIFFK